MHVNHADAKTVDSWRRRVKQRITRLKKDGFVAAVEDEAFFVQGETLGRKYWSDEGTRAKIPYSGNRKRLTVFGAIVDDGRQLFRTTTKGFNNKTFIPFVRELLRRFKKVILIVDGASPHRSKLLKETFGKNKNIKFILLPKASSYLNASEQCWQRGKKVLLDSEYYESFDDMRNAISKYYRTATFNLDIYKFLNRKTSEYA